MEQLASAGLYSPPRLSSLETVLQEALSWKHGRVFADLWDAAQFADSAKTAALQISRLEQMNLTQSVT
jgi:hypothetical protein